MRRNPDLSLIAFVRRRWLNFERFVEVLSTRGYITEQDDEEGWSMGSSAMEAVRQHEFDALFALLMPGGVNSIELSCRATAEGGMPGSFAYALFNTNLIDYAQVHQVLVKENQNTAG